MTARFPPDGPPTQDMDGASTTRSAWVAFEHQIEPAASDGAAGRADVVTEGRRQEALLTAEALQSAIFNSANFSSIATDAKGVIQIFNVGAERMLGYTAADRRAHV